ncbi:hypothetical protein E2C01_058127 [Portunus trituberculatus]|uniref:Uncharacterized protein n=1 Tax=Portunus trituberculatus TaxID=210409 RepID=A0A5B7H3V8_PORTR|nr:hypothetical protein [Portunus trituberculatus]
MPPIFPVTKFGFNPIGSVSCHQNSWEGPYSVEEALTDVTYHIKPGNVGAILCWMVGCPGWDGLGGGLSSVVDKHSHHVPETCRLGFLTRGNGFLAVSLLCRQARYYLMSSWTPTVSAQNQGKHFQQGRIPHHCFAVCMSSPY